jgi:hypothetical protein
MFGFSGPKQGDALIRDLEGRLIAVKGSISLAIVTLEQARRSTDIADTCRIIDKAIDTLERARNRAEL